MSTIAILLAAYNGKEWLKEQLESILDQKDVHFHIFISVDTSSDGTEEFVDEIAAVDKRVTVLPHGKKFGGPAANFFRLIIDVNFENFDYVSFADQDDIWFSDKLKRASTELQRTGADGYSSNVTAFWPNGRKMLIIKSQPQKKWDFLFEAGAPGCTYVMTVKLALIIKKFIYENNSSIKEVWMHDWFCYSFARAYGYKWFIDEFSSMLYRQHLENEVGVNSGRRAMLYRVKKIIDGLGMRQSVLFANLFGLSENSFVKKWVHGQRFGRIFLAFKAKQCRRRPRDQVLFIFSCLLMAIVSRNK